MADRHEQVAFLLSLVPWLVGRDRVAVSEAASHFGVPAERIREAVRLLVVTGVPGVTRSYQHDDLFDIDWDAFEQHDEIVLTHFVALEGAPRLSAREAAAVIAGLQYISALPGNADNAAIATLLGKLSRSASAAPSPLAVEALGSRAALGPIREALDRGVQLELEYLSADGRRESRRVDPLRVDTVDEVGYLRGWCHLRGAVRTFRLDRIAAATVTGEPIEHPAGEVPLPDALFQASPDDVEVELELSAAALPLLGDFLRDGDLAEAGPGRVRARVRVAHLHGLKRMAASLPGLVTVVAPEEARAVVRDWAAAGLARYR